MTFWIAQHLKDLMGRRFDTTRLEDNVGSRKIHVVGHLMRLTVRYRLRLSHEFRVVDLTHHANSGD